METHAPKTPCSQQEHTQPTMPSPPIPKPSQVRFRKKESPCSENTTDTRLLVIRQSPQFDHRGKKYTMIYWCRPTDETDTTLDTIPQIDSLHIHDLLDKEHFLVQADAHGCKVLVGWHITRPERALDVMCDVLIEEYQRRSCQPLELYTPVIKFASAFCDTFARVEGISWVSNYQARTIRLDEVCINICTQLINARKEHLRMTQSWSSYCEQSITGHGALPDNWIRANGTIHIAADASYSRHSGGASAFISSLGDFMAIPAHGKSILCCELLAILRALEYARKIPGRVVIWSDSRLALNHISRLNTDHSPTLRAGALHTLDSINTEIEHRKTHDKEPVIFRWIKAHTDCSSLQRILNDGADRLARHTMRNVCQGQFTPTLASVCETIVADCMNNLATLDPHTICTPEEASIPLPTEDTDDTDSCR